MSSCARFKRCDPRAKTTNNVPVTASAIHAVQSNAFEFGNWPDEKWWVAFDDEELNYLIQLGLENSPLLKELCAKVESAEQEAKVVGSKMFPDVGAIATMLYAHLPKNGLLRSVAPTVPAVIHPLILGIGFEYEIDFWQKNWNGYQAALGLAKSVEALQSQTELMVTIGIASEYYIYLANREKLMLMNDLLDDYNQLYNLSVNLQKYRIASSIDVLEMQEKVLSAQKQIEALQDELDHSKHSLGTLLGMGPDFTEELIEQFKPFQDRVMIPDDIELNLLSRRPDLTAQIWKVQAAAREIKVAQSLFYPNVSLAGLGGFDSIEFRNYFNSKSLLGTLVPAISLPIFTGGRLRANLGVKKAKFEMLIHEYNEMVLNAAKEVADRLSEVSSLTKQVAVQKEHVQTVSDEEALIRLRYVNRVDSKLSVLKANAELLEKKIVEVELEKWKYYSVLGFIKSIGGGYISPVKIECTTGESNG
ncbi:MAG: putative efflux pump outer membrane protein TtgC [Chlamydiia bacterium]|nr:putative efflux pump outer membrane protein TtgC [Chlamydiia bacterium]